MATLDSLLAAVEAGRWEPLFLLAGDRVLAEPAALRLAEGLAARSGCQVEVHRRPTSLGPLLADLRTFSLFGTAKVTVAVESAVVADAQAAADLLDEAAEVLPLTAGSELTGRERRAAALLLQTLQLFQAEAGAGGAEEALGRLPAWAFEGGAAFRSRRGGRGRGKRQAEELRSGLVELLTAAQAAEIASSAESDLTELSELLERGLPEGHALVLAESAAPPKHPLVRALAERQAFVDLGRVEADRRGGWQGLDLLAAELERETGAPIRGDALAALADRTLQQAGRRQAGGADADSTARFAAEYRKLATLSGGGGHRPCAGRVGGRGPRAGGRLEGARRGRQRPRRRGAVAARPPAGGGRGSGRRPALVLRPARRFRPPARRHRRHDAARRGAA